jgi:glycosyltransferase involved in cell wall biosynthesis
MEMSIVIPTYNRLPILRKCIEALEAQSYNFNYEIVVIDDGSDDGTIEWIESNRYVHVVLYKQVHQGAAVARNLGIEKSIYETIIFIDSDLVVTGTFLSSHAEALRKERRKTGNDRQFSYGSVINTANFEDPTSEPYKLSDYSAAFFATGNVAIAKHWLICVGQFDTRFQQYGWEDLELGVRLKIAGLTLIKCPNAVGYHWHPAFTLEQLPHLIDQEIQRGRMGVLFYQLHPTWEVRMMIQLTIFHRLLWEILTLGGFLQEQTLAPILRWLINQKKPHVALEVSRIFLNLYNTRSVYSAYIKSIH